MLTSWAALLDLMATKANSAADKAAESDISQLRGLTDRMDAEAFLPWRSEDLGPEFARRVLGLITLIDEATDRGCVDGFLDIGGMMKSPRYEGYGRHMRIGGVAAWFGFVMDGWAVHGTTPLWLLFTEDKHKELQEAGLADTKVVKWRTGDRRYCIPIELLTGVEYDAVLDSVVASLKSIADQLAAQAPNTQGSCLCHNNVRFACRTLPVKVAGATNNLYSLSTREYPDCRVPTPRTSIKTVSSLRRSARSGKRTAMSSSPMRCRRKIWMR